VLIGANGLGKTMLLKNLAYHAVLKACSARFTLASDMLLDLAAQDSTTALARRLRRYTSPTILAIDEVELARHYFAQLRRHYSASDTPRPDAADLDLGSASSDPPF
jgi:DNA replication protein DnaC